MKALIICRNLKNAISDKRITSGFVHSVFTGACNIETENAFLTLLCKEKEMAPMSVVVGGEDTVDFIKLGICRGLKFDFSADCISCSDKSILIGLEDAESWFPGMMPDCTNCTEETIAENLKTMEAGINTYGKHYIISPLVSLLENEIPDLGIPAFNAQAPDNSIEFIKSRFLSFIRAVVEEDMKGINEKAGRLIGFGPGLTPSMDDFICGIMVASVYMAGFYKLDVSRVYEFNRRLMDGNLGRTTRVSAEMLKHAAAGETNQAARELIRAILDRQDVENVLNALVRAIDLGETSGSDLALGIYAGCKIMIAKIKYRGEFFNEALCRC